MRKTRWWLFVGAIGAIGFLVYRMIAGRDPQTRHDDSPASAILSRIAGASMIAMAGVRGYIDGYIHGYKGSRDVRVETDVFVSSPNRENDDL